MGIASTSEAGRVILLDPSLGAASGHHSVVVGHYRKLLKPRTIIAAGHRGGQMEMPVFRHRLEDAFRLCRYAAPWMAHSWLVSAVRIWKRRFHVRRDAALPAAAMATPLDEGAFASLFAGLRVGEALDVLWRKVGPRAGDSIVSLGTDPAMVAALYQRRALFAGANSPNLHLLFMYPEADFLSPTTERAYWSLARALSDAATGVHAELAAHAALLGAALQRDVGLQLTPVRLELLPPPPSGVFTLATLGAGRADKGYDALPGIAAAMQVASPEIALRIQLPEPGSGLEASTRALRELPNVTLLPPTLSDAAYEAELTRAHALLLPYDKARYAVRGSGILIDALIGGRPILCTAGTALEASILGGNGLAAAGAEAFVRAAVALRTDYSRFLAAARRDAGRSIPRGSLIQAIS